MKKAKRILYLDDERNNLITFKSLFEDDYEIFITQSPEEALKILSKNEIQIIISDQRMPNITGVDFLSSIKNTYPQPNRILLTGYLEIQALIDAINSAKIHQYISKPWDEFEMRISIENAFHSYYERNTILDVNSETNLLEISLPAKNKQSNSNKIFISHANKDSHIVNSFVDNFLKLGLGIQNENIFYSSIEVTGIKSGEDFRNRIRKELIEAKAIILIITENYKQSEICLNEMGAAWVTNDIVIPFILDPVTYSNVGIIHSPNQLLKLNDRKNLIKFVEDYKGVLFNQHINFSSLDRHLTVFLGSI